MLATAVFAVVLFVINHVGWKGLTVPIHYDNPRMDPESGRRLAELMGEECEVRVLGVGESLAL